MNVVILGFGELSPGGWTNPQWMASTMASAKYNVTYFNPPAYRFPQISDFKRLLYRFKPAKALYTFKVINLYYPFKFLSGLFNSSLKKCLRDSDIVIVFHPNWLRCIHHRWLCQKRVIYFKTDDYGSLSKENSYIHRAEELMVDIASYVCVTSKNLLRGLKHEIYCPNCIPAYLLEPRSVSETVTANMHKDKMNVCYVGAIWDDKVDVRMLMDAIERSSKFHFHFAGKIFSTEFLSFIRSSQCSNISYHGVLPFDQGFELMAACDVGLMPFLLNKYTDSMFSMKFFEYVAAGTPVLMTEIKMLEYLDDFIDVIEVSDVIDDEQLLSAKSLSENIESSWPSLTDYTYESRISKLKRLKIL
jgi:hypothetical protein